MSTTVTSISAAIAGTVAAVAAATALGVGRRPEILHRRPDLGRARHAGCLGHEAARDRSDGRPRVQHRRPAARSSRPARAKNINTVDEVPDSSWFTNRAGHRPLTPEDVANGPGHERTARRRAPGRSRRRRATASRPASRSRMPTASAGSSSSIRQAIARWRRAPKSR